MSLPLATLDTWTAAPRRHRLPSAAGVRNQMLAHLPEVEFHKVMAQTERVPLRPRQVLMEANAPVSCVHFIEEGTASILSRVDRGKMSEISIVGTRGFVGIPLVLGTRRSPFRCVVHTSGSAWRIAGPQFQELDRSCPVFSKLLRFNLQARLVQHAQLNICNASHTLHQRVCRWILLALERLESNEVHATHDLISRMLGVRRPGVTRVIGDLERSGALAQTRGSLSVQDIALLEACACNCHHVIRTEYDRLHESALGI